MEEALITYLLANAGVEALVGRGIDWSVRQQGRALPSIVLHLIVDVPQYTFAGRAPLRECLVQIDCWAGTYPAAKGLARAVLAALDGLDQPPLQALVRTERDDHERGPAPNAAGQTDFHRASLDVRVVFTPTP